MKKRIFTLALLVLLTVPMIFANGAVESASKEPEIVVTDSYIGNKNAETVFTVAIGKDETIISQYPERRELAKKVYTEWANAHPEYGVEVQYVDSSQIAVSMSKYLTEAEMGVAPDLLHLDSFYLGLFMEAGVLQPFDGLIPQEELDQWFDWTKDITCGDDGHQYAIWGETDARLLYYRKDLVPNPPRTWDELIEIGSKISKETGMYGFLSPTGQSEAASNEGTWSYFWAQGGEIFGEDNRPILGEGENRQYMINIYQFWKDCIDSGASPQEIASMVDGSPIIAEVAAGNVAMFVGGTWTWSQIQDIAPNPEDWAFTYLPMPESDMYGTSCGGWTFALLTDDPAKQEAAVSFLMARIASKDAMYERCVTHSQLPVRKDVFDMEYFAQDPVLSEFKKHFEVGGSRPASSLYPAVSDINAKMLNKVLVGALTPEEAVDQLQADCLKEWETWKANRNL